MISHPHFVQYLSFRNTAATEIQLENYIQSVPNLVVGKDSKSWFSDYRIREKNVRLWLKRERVHDTISLLRQYKLEGIYSSEEAYSIFSEGEKRTRFPVQTIGKTTVLFGQVKDSDRIQFEKTLAATLSPSSDSVHRIKLGETAILCEFMNSKWLMLLHDLDDDQEFANSLLYTQLRLAEIFVHKIGFQYDEYMSSRDAFLSTCENARRQCNRLGKAIESLETLSAKAELVTAMRESSHTRELNREIIDATSMMKQVRASLESNSRNFRSLTLIPHNIEDSMLYRRQRIENYIQQLDSDLETATPLVRQTDSAVERHQTQLLTCLNRIELEEAELRANEAKQQHITNSLIAFFGIWLAVAQIAVAVFLQEEFFKTVHWLYKLIYLVAPSLIVGVLIWFVYLVKNRGQ